ncbi:very short patch repair endonuclease [Gordonia metallireducens]|uniref:very short patch repair endonuclease n=1 Tax=Gordonia metallireducens TaxID=2897779 RepID=UPI0027E175C3|nr:very short patch repair endonuclease [Gordonia metallireducens]
MNTAPLGPESGGSFRPPPSSPAVRSRMSRQKSRDTGPEIAVRRALHARGIRYRVDVKLEPDMRTRADLAWRGLKLAVFIDGCFWHGCPEHATRPAANRDWWAQKLDANIARDRRTDDTLRNRGWVVRRFWEHQSPEEIADELVKEIRDIKA